MEDIYIFGHVRPDTDSVTSAIALSYLKNKIGIKSKPCILSEINSETKFVLKFFNTNIPDLLEDVKIQVKDVNYYKNCYVNQNDSIYNTYSFMSNNTITGVPIVDNKNKFLGLLTSQMIVSYLLNSSYNKIYTSYKNIIDVLKGEEVLEFDKEIMGFTYFSHFKKSSNVFNKETILIIDDNVEVIDAAIKAGVKLIILVNGTTISNEQVILAKANKINIIRTHFDFLQVCKLINLSNYIKSIIDNSRNITINENMYYDDFKVLSAKLGFNNYPVISNSGICLGLMRVTDINKISKKRVILVDHNEEKQSVEGLNEAEIVEIVDHHNLGSITTNMPINFRNMTVGSTNTIIYSLYNESNIEIPRDIAGLMLSGIISDTLKFTSPTTTEYDKYVAERLSNIAYIDIDSFAKEMFEAGTDFSEKTIEEIINTDIKTYDVNNKKIIISQVITLSSEQILNKKEEYINTLNNYKKLGNDIVILCVTDLIKNGSYIFFNSESKDVIASMFNFEDIDEGYFFSNCLSRKKQILPLVMSVLG